MAETLKSETAAMAWMCQCGQPMINPIWCSGGHANMQQSRALLRCGICYCAVERQYIGKHDAWHRSTTPEDADD